MVVQKDAIAWEQWVYSFAAVRQLVVLAPFIPTADPQLRTGAYELVLENLLRVPSELLKLIQAWPPHLYSLPAITTLVVTR